MKNQASKALKELRNGNPITELWHQLGIDNLLVVHSFKVHETYSNGHYPSHWQHKK
jgi:hypothetical protein